MQKERRHSVSNTETGSLKFAKDATDFRLSFYDRDSDSLSMDLHSQKIQRYIHSE